MIGLKDLSIHYGSKLLFDQVDLLLNPGNRYAVVGANGTGKSTLLRLIMGQETPSLGEINLPKDVTIGWVKQDHYRFEDQKLLDVVIQGKAPLWQAIQAKEQLLQGEWTDSAAHKLMEYEEIIIHYDGYMAESLAHILLEGLGLPLSEHEKPLALLSGGYKMRVLLAQALFESPDILLLDEPTNHLDIMTIRWLEQYLINEYKGLLLFVSHDIQFLKNVSTHILDIDYGEIREYPGSYNHFLMKKKEVMDQKLHEKRHIEDKIAVMQRFVDRFKAKASKAKAAQSRVKMIEKMELPDVKQTSRISPTLSFECKRPSGKQVLKISELSKSFGEKRVLNKINLEINRGEKVAIIGHNGIGKSTLLKIALGLLETDHGEIEWGYETHKSYFAQDHHEQLKQDISVYDWLCDQAPTQTSTKVRNMLGQVLFTKDEVEKNILNISGGEAAKLLLAGIMLANPNVLILDEPTNHLDVESIETFLHALKKYEGTIILVSHDRHFVAKIATRVIALTENGIKDFRGTYAEYLKYYKEDYLSQAFLAKQK
ncbi:MAG: ABC-F family ATP-binding cassette domain-containing protein [Candidatus Berkiellales bacterium]